MPFIKENPTKSYELQPDNTWKKISDYPPMKHFRGIEQEFEDLRDFYQNLKEIATKKVFMIHGKFKEGIDTSKMRRKSRSDEATIVPGMLDLFVVDVDGYEMELEDGINPNTAAAAIEDFILDFLPEEFSKCDYAYQLSSSFGLTSDKLKAHLFFAPKTTIHSETLRKWSMKWNAAHERDVIDSAVYKAVQPIYTCHRLICISEKHDMYADPFFDPDPFPQDDMIGYVDKGNSYLNWEPSDIELVKSDCEQFSKGNLVGLTNEKEYDLSTSIRKIMTAENFHDQIRSTALSLMNKNVSPKDCRSFIEEFMRVAKQNIKDQDRLDDWKARFDDIPRAVESAIEIVNEPTIEDVLEWMEGSTVDQIKKGFAKKLVNFEGVELKSIIREIDKVLGHGPRAINDDVKTAKAEHMLEMQTMARKIKSEERKSQNIFEIEIHNSNYGSVTQNVCKVLAASEKKPEVYKLGNTLSIIENSIPKTIRQISRKGRMQDDYPEMPIVHSIDSPVGLIRSRVEKDCVFINETGKEIVCPDSILNAVPRMYGVNWNPLSGIVEHPFIDDKWELIEKSGYDYQTGLYTYLHNKLKIKLIDPVDAYNYLSGEVLAEFPFQTDLDMTAAIGMFMTAVQRPYVTGDHGMPGYAIVSPKPSSGKTTLAQLLSYSIYNRPVAATGWSDSDEELGKHLLAILREGHSCVLFDNIKKDAAIQSNELAKAMTSGTYSRRKLGVNETEEVPSSVLWLFTGNNIVFKGDFATRILPIRIVPNVERPEFRKFIRQDIGQWAMDNRKHIISAVLSIVMAGRDIDYSKYESAARFKEWNRFVRIPLMELTGRDLLDVFDRNDFLDDETVAKGELLEMLFKTFKSNTFITKDLMKIMEGEVVEGANVAVDSTGLDFKHAITESFNEKATTNIKTLGKYIHGMKDFILRGYMLIREDSTNMATWRVIKLEEEGEAKN